VIVDGTGSLKIDNGNTLTNYDLGIQGGKLTASGVTFANRLFVDDLSKVTLTGSNTFNNYAEFRFNSGGVGSTVTGNTFKGNIGVSPQYVSKLPANTFSAGTVVTVLSRTISNSQTWPLIPNVSSFNLNGNVIVDGTGSLKIDNGNTLTNYDLGIQNGGTLVAPAVKFKNRLFLGEGSKGSIEYSTFLGNGLLNIDGKTLVVIKNNDLSKTTATSQGSGGPINLKGNFWGTTVIQDIETLRVSDKQDDAGRPDIDVSSPLSINPIPPDLTASGLTVPGGTWFAGDVLNVSYRDL